LESGGMCLKLKWLRDLLLITFLDLNFEEIKKLVSVRLSHHKIPLPPRPPAPCLRFAFKLERFEMEKMKEN